MDKTKAEKTIAMWETCPKSYEWVRALKAIRFHIEPGTDAVLLADYYKACESVSYLLTGQEEPNRSFDPGVMRMIREELKKEKYNFLRSNPHLGDNIVMYGLGGSHAYGTNNEGSDIDIRGIALNTKREILLGRDFESIADTETDTIFYSIKKMFCRLSECHPNSMELLGLMDDQVLYADDFVWPLLRKNKDAFLSKKCVASFGMRANDQIQKLKVRAVKCAKREMSGQSMPGSRNCTKDIMRHIRWYFMCFDILKYGEINTFRPDEHALLMDIREGKFQDENGDPIQEFYDMADDLNYRLEELASSSQFPDRPDMGRIEKMLMQVQEYALEKQSR